MYPTMKTVLDHIAAGRKIDAIKTLRMLHGMGLKEGKEMVEAIEPFVRKPQPKVDPMVGRVLIVDSKNPDRVLGSVERPRGSSPRLDGGDCYNMAVMSPLSVTMRDPYSPIEHSVSYVRFGFRCVNWTVVLTTDASLDLLAKLDSFRFPGEDAEQAHVRGMYAR